MADPTDEAIRQITTDGRTSSDFNAVWSPTARLDSVYFFMWPGWREELESNRWHWGKRWARRLPVVFIQPELAQGEAASANPELRLHNIEILSVEARSAEPECIWSVGLRQCGQIAAHMLARGHERPLFWLYNPWLLVPSLLLPAAARVYHATENYFDFDNLPESWLALNRYSIKASDIVICCSRGVARGLAAHIGSRDFVTLSNGCEYSKYKRPTLPRGKWPSLIADWRQSKRRLAVFAGNIDLRLDYELLGDLAVRHPDIGFVLAGPINFASLSARQREECDALLRLSNVRSLGRLPPEDLPALYWSCDVGILPYRTDMRMLVENGFPLKALEMAAAGLPVVSSLMKPLQEVSDAVVVVGSQEAFSLALASHSRRTRSDAAHEAADRICRAYDYDVIFEEMLGELARHLRDGPPQPGNLADFVANVGVDAFRCSLARLAPIPLPTASPRLVATLRQTALKAIALKIRIPFRYRVGQLLGIIPQPIRRRVPIAMRQLGRRWMA
jgi:glycosyltransferase involved in cell wall biosynthesis